MSRKQSKRKGRLRIGTSGWQYNHWKKVFYPTSMSKSDWFEYYAKRFGAVEVNNTFYHLPEPETFEAWKRKAPRNFLYTLKFSRYGSHIKKLKNPENSVDHFLDRAERLGKHLGVILVQLPPSWSVNVERLEQFLAHRPGRHRWALEFRHESWLCRQVFDLLRNQKVALCIHDMIADHPREITADWVYLRFHGPGPWGDYPYQALSASARRIRSWRQEGLDVHAYFNNDAHGHAVHNALDLRRYVTDTS